MPEPARGTVTPSEADLLAVLELLAGTDGARGRERAAAQALAVHAAGRWPAVDWRVEPVGDPAGPCAQLVAVAGERDGGGELLLCSHLDTSLTGNPALDVAVTGVSEPAAPFRVDPASRTVLGPGLGVARGPAAAALVGFARAAETLAGTGRPYGIRLLLAARGTHRAEDWGVAGGEPATPPGPTGVGAYLSSHPHPRAAVIAKGGPAGVLHDEPGACYLRVRLRGRWGAVMSRERLVPEGGLNAHLGTFVDAVERSGRALVAAAQPGPQAGGQFGIGAVRSGSPSKPDLTPGAVDVYCYLVAPGPMPAGATASAMARRVRSTLGGTPLADLEVTVDEQLIHEGGCTDPQQPVVRAAERAYREVLGRAPGTITGWTGSTDGVVLRGAGVPTARVGPSRTSARGDGSDVAYLDELLSFTRLYERLCVELG